ncbi:hypothetical protein PRUPE_4G214100 [Prunus persica]|uniref:Uncharacterized protein n=1 Tax=Prunus persica TaxID=3760 RepID=M5WI53_PRUPE|nr:hypothetical protein PRUPE_4G214100 [Prunus persica]
MMDLILCGMCEIMVGLLREENSSISIFVVNFVPPGLAKACFLSFFLWVTWRQARKQKTQQSSLAEPCRPCCLIQLKLPFVFEQFLVEVIPVCLVFSLMVGAAFVTNQ